MESREELLLDEEGAKAALNEVVLYHTGATPSNDSKITYGPFAIGRGYEA